MRDHEKLRRPAGTTEIDVRISTIQPPRTIKLPPPPDWIIDIYDYADPKDAAICSLLVELD